MKSLNWNLFSADALDDTLDITYWWLYTILCCTVVQRQQVNEEMIKWRRREKTKTKKQNTSTTIYGCINWREFFWVAYKYTKLSTFVWMYMSHFYCGYSLSYMKKTNPLQTIEYSYKRRISSCAFMCACAYERMYGAYAQTLHEYYILPV